MMKVEPREHLRKFVLRVDQMVKELERVDRPVHPKNIDIVASFNDWGGGRGCHKFVPVLGGDSTKIALTGYFFYQPFGGNELDSGQARRPCRGPYSPIHGSGCFDDLAGDGIVVSPPLPIFETLCHSGRTYAAV